MRGLIITLIVIAAILVFWLWTLHPNFRRRKETLAFAKWNYAHRGLWDMDLAIPENSMPAFERAVEHGYAIELDVHLTKDDRLIIFHDETLKRMSSSKLETKVEDMTYEQLQSFTLLDTNERIPLFSDVLKMVDGKVPILVELKAYSTKIQHFCQMVDKMLSSYKGAYMVESFNPFALRWYKKNRPKVLRGQLSSFYEKVGGIEGAAKKASSSLTVNMLSRPDFIAYNHKHTTGWGFQLNKHLYKAPTWAWTIKSNEERETAQTENGFDAVIFERFLA